MLGPAKGCAIKIDYFPAWAVGSAGAIAAFPLLDGFDRLYIFAENDKSGANEKAILACRDRWAGLTVTAIRPRDGYNDLQ